MNHGDKVKVIKTQRVGFIDQIEPPKEMNEAPGKILPARYIVRFGSEQKTDWLYAEDIQLTDSAALENYGYGEIPTDEAKRELYLLCIEYENTYMDYESPEYIKCRVAEIKARMNAMCQVFGVEQVMSWKRG